MRQQARKSSQSGSQSSMHSDTVFLSTALTVEVIFISLIRNHFDALVSTVLDHPSVRTGTSVSRCTRLATYVVHFGMLVVAVTGC